jgi:hypothetical protein
MDAAIEDGRGIAPQFEFGPEAQPGTHLVQAAGGQTTTASISAPEGVCTSSPSTVMCRSRRIPTEFVTLADEAWEPGL